MTDAAPPIDEAPPDGEPSPDDGAPPYLPLELWAAVFAHVEGDLYLTTRAAFLAACRDFARAAETFRPPEPGVFLEARAPDGTLCRGCRIPAETFARYESRLQPLGLIAWPTEPAAVGQAVTYSIHNHANDELPARVVYDIELQALRQSAQDVGQRVHTHAAREVLAAWTAERLPADSDLRVHLRALSEFARTQKTIAFARDPVICGHPIGQPGNPACPDCPAVWKVPLTDEQFRLGNAGILYEVAQNKGLDLSDALSERLAPYTIGGPILLPPWHVTFARLHEFNAKPAAGTVRLDRIVRLLPVKDVREAALAELLERLRAAGAAFADLDAELGVVV